MGNFCATQETSAMKKLLPPTRPRGGYQPFSRCTGGEKFKSYKATRGRDPYSVAGEFWCEGVVVDGRVEDAQHGVDVVVDGDGGGGWVLSVPLSSRSRASGPARSVPLGPPIPTAGRIRVPLSYSRNRHT